ncbi:MAG: hypothetical protein Q7N50_13360 [Armatimonadota bacterium]|nr:hypothetical protein [Armatimonadota bacterium]
MDHTYKGHVTMKIPQNGYLPSRLAYARRIAAASPDKNIVPY